MTSSQTILYGIATCSTCKKARNWLDEQGQPYRFHDFRKDGLDPDWLQTLIGRMGYEALINRRGTSWRQLDASLKADLTPARALALMLEYPALIKRPVLERGDEVLIGFTPQSGTERP